MSGISILLDTTWLTTAIKTLNSWVWSPALVALCLLTALYFSIRTRLVQVRRFREMCRLLFSTDKKQKTGISSFQAFAMALSGRVGTGNIVGVATAIGFGGPGAIVWMWVIAFFGAGSAFVEATLAQIYKENHNGQFRGGPAYYIEKGLRSPLFGSLFAIIAAIACGFFMPPVQCNGIAISMSDTFGVAPWIVGTGVALLIALVIIGGVKRIAQVAQIIAPFMAIIYIILSIVVIAVNYKMVPDVFMEMLRGAVGASQVGSAILGSTIAWGVKRGIYSNEAGQGTGPIVAAAAKVSHPVKQGLVQAFSVYIDTLLVCTATALMILACNTYNIIDQIQDLPSGEKIITYHIENPSAPKGEPGVLYTSNALATVIGSKPADTVIEPPSADIEKKPTPAGMVISIALFFFAFTTIMAYYYYAETNLVYLFSRFRTRRLSKHKKSMNTIEAMEAEANCKRANEVFGDDRSEKAAIWVLRILTIMSVFLGSTTGSGVAWTLGDIGVGAMAWINLVAILLLSPKALRALKDYEQAKRRGEEPHFDAERLKIEGADFWKETPKQ